MFRKEAPMKRDPSPAGEGQKSAGNKLALGFVALVVAGGIAYQTLSKQEVNEAEPESLAEAGPVQINMWDQEEATNVVHLDKWIAEFEKENPNIDVTRQTFQSEDLRNRYTTFATGGQAAEVLYGPNDFAGVFSRAGIISEISTFVNPERFTKASLEAVRLGGKFMGVPMSYGNHLMLYYNKSMIPEPPKTTDELIEVGKKFSDPVAKTYGIVFFQNEPFWIAPIIGGFGGWPIDYSTGEAKINLNTEGVIKALTFVRDLKDKEKIIPSECDYDCAKGLFIEGKAPMTINGDWAAPEFREALGRGNLGIAPLPIVSATGQPMAPMVSGRYLFLNASLTPAKKEAVAKFVQFMTSERVQKEVGSLMNRIPANKAALESPEVQSLPDLQPLIEAARNGRAMPAETEMRAAWDAMRPAVQKVLSGDLEPSEAARLMQQSALEKLTSLKE